MARRKPKAVYQWRQGYRSPVAAQAAGEELARIEAENGHVHPRTVVEESRPEAAPLHEHFEWDDPRAAELYRDEQARGLIRSVRVVSAGAEEGGEPAPSIAYVHVTTEERGSTYVTAARAMGEDDLRQQVLAEAVALLRGIRRRYAELTELQAVFAAVDRLQPAG